MIRLREITDRELQFRPQITQITQRRKSTSGVRRVEQVSVIRRAGWWSKLQGEVISIYDHLGVMAESKSYRGPRTPVAPNPRYLQTDTRRESSKYVP